MKNFFDLEIAYTSQAHEVESKKHYQLQKKYAIEGNRLYMLTILKIKRKVG